MNIYNVEYKIYASHLRHAIKKLNDGSYWKDVSDVSKNDLFGLKSLHR